MTVQNIKIYSLQNRAFTLAEVLTTLGVIGIIAAMTLPALIGKCSEFITINQLKYVYSDLSNAIKLSETVNGDFRDWDWTNSAKFTETYILPYLSNNYTKCKWGRPCFGKNYDFKNLNNTNVAGYISALSPHYKYNGKTMVSYVNNIPRPETCAKCTDIKYAEFFIDINGDRGPSILGKDVFLFTLFNYTYNTGGWVLTELCPKGEHYGLHLGSIAGYWGGYCRPLEDMFTGNPGTCKITSTGADCGLAIEKNGWKIPAQYPIKL